MAGSTRLKKIKLGDLLVEAGYITKEQLDKALFIQKEEGSKLGDVLVQLKFVNENQVIDALSKQLNIPFIDLRQQIIKPEIIRKIPERISRRYQVIALDEKEDGTYLVGMTDPTDLVAYDELVRVLKADFQLAIVLERDLLYLFDLVYRKTEEIVSFAEALKKELVQDEKQASEFETISANAAPVVKLLDSIFADAVQMGASDIHIEPGEGMLRIRQRVDGVLHEHILPGQEIISALVLRIKLISNMNISERRLPQDGRFSMVVKDHNFDIRVAIMPEYYGEAVVMRLLDQSKGILKMEQLGMPDEMRDNIMQVIHKPNGIILVTGPTGSGKTTTLYAMLNEINVPEVNIITVEDPVEYVLPRLNQIQVNTAIDLTFSTILRSVLRHDPDIIMVGEMRDNETVSIGLRAALTGHLVFSTLHTNDAISSTIRLLDMGAQGYLVGGALRGVLAQRLIRKICDSCAKPYVPTEAEQAFILGFLGKNEHAFTFQKGTGCSRCSNSGYRGRTGIYEYIEIDGAMANALRTNDTNLFIKLGTEQLGKKTLNQQAFDAAATGLTTLLEFFRIVGEYI